MGVGAHQPSSMALCDPPENRKGRKQKKKVVVSGVLKLMVLTRNTKASLSYLHKRSDNETVYAVRNRLSKHQTG